MSDTPIADVSDTALWVAAYRAIESERPDALFHDPLARRLTGERGRRIADEMRYGRYTQWSVVIRTYIIDAFLRERLAEGLDTVVNLGAGLDTRPYRLDLPADLRWVEVDFPRIIALKNTELRDARPRCRLERIELDLSNAAARRSLLAKLGAESRSALILTEGVVPYLSVAETGSLADDLRAQNSFRYWIVDYFAAQVMRFIQRQRRTQMRNAPFRFAPEDWFGFFEQHGWICEEMRYLGEVSRTLGRPIPMPWWASILIKLAPPERQAAQRKLLGYCLLTPR